MTELAELDSNLARGVGAEAAAEAILAAEHRTVKHHLAGKT